MILGNESKLGSWTAIVAVGLSRFIRMTEARVNKP